jgi:hypothetical protein
VFANAVSKDEGIIKGEASMPLLMIKINLIVLQA